MEHIKIRSVNFAQNCENTLRAYEKVISQDKLKQKPKIIA